jgi:hypothetical protein
VKLGYPNSGEKLYEIVDQELEGSLREKAKSNLEWGRAISREAMQALGA